MISGISDRAEFARLRSEGLHVRSRDLRCRYLLSNDASSDISDVQIAYSISRKVGNAVVRNRIRRRLRALFAETDRSPALVPMRSLMVIVLPGAAALAFDDLQDQVLELMKKIEKSRETAQ